MPSFSYLDQVSLYDKIKQKLLGLLSLKVFFNQYYFWKFRFSFASNLFNVTLLDLGEIRT